MVPPLAFGSHLAQGADRRFGFAFLERGMGKDLELRLEASFSLSFMIRLGALRVVLWLP